MTRDDAAGARVPAIETLRALAIVLVFVFHFLAPFGGSLGLAPEVSRFLRALGQAGFDVFFFVTGFVCYRALMARPRPVGRWFLQRIERVYPLFAPVFLAWVVLALVFPDKSRVPGAQPEATIYLLQNFVLMPGPFPIEPLMGAAWALGYGMVFCVALPLFVAAFRLVRAHWLVRAAVIVLAGVACAVWFTWAGGPTRLAMFAAGMLVHEFISRPVAPGRALRAIAVALGVGLLGIALFLPALPLPRMPTRLLDGIKVLLMAAAFVGIGVAMLRAAQAGGAGSVSSGSQGSPVSRAMRIVGILAVLAYPMYLIHTLVLQIGSRAIEAVAPPGWAQPVAWLALPALFACALLVAWAMAAVESRVMRRG